MSPSTTYVLLAFCVVVVTAALIARHFRRRHGPSDKEDKQIGNAIAVHVAGVIRGGLIGICGAALVWQSTQVPDAGKRMLGYLFAFVLLVLGAYLGQRSVRRIAQLRAQRDHRRAGRLE
jgi:hypothetical protein